MEDSSFESRSWPGPRIDPRDGAAPLSGQDSEDAAPIDMKPAHDPFPLATAAALRLWLVSALILALAAGGAWTMRRPNNAVGSRALTDLAAGPAADHAQAPAR
jgi:hypothetical protein